jgi:hypothetical protein
MQSRKKSLLTLSASVVVIICGLLSIALIHSSGYAIGRASAINGFTATAITNLDLLPEIYRFSQRCHHMLSSEKGCANPNFVSGRPSLGGSPYFATFSCADLSTATIIMVDGECYR